MSKPESIPFLALEAEQDTSNCSQSATTTSTSMQAKTTRTKPPHHALGVTLAVVGIAALASGVVLLAGEHAISVCTPASNGCNEARDAGIALIPIGAGVAATGFYFPFHP